MTGLKVINKFSVQAKNPKEVCF